MRLAASRVHSRCEALCRTLAGPAGLEDGSQGGDKKQIGTAIVGPDHRRVSRRLEVTR